MEGKYLLVRNSYKLICIQLKILYKFLFKLDEKVDTSSTICLVLVLVLSLLSEHTVFLFFSS